MERGAGVRLGLVRGLELSSRGRDAMEAKVTQMEWRHVTRLIGLCV